jgi:iron(II)-dependent oxidoreductase
MNQTRLAKTIKNFEVTRNKTLQIFDLADEDALQSSPGFGFRPIIWHLAHIGTFEEYWLLQKVGGQAVVNERFHSIFDPIKTPRESSKSLPSKAEMLDYLQIVRDNALKVLENFDFNSNDPLFRDGYVFDLVHQHELQHQETLAYLFHLLPLEKVRSEQFKVNSFNIKTQFEIRDSLEFDRSNFTIGAAEDKFAYDNEMPAHLVTVPAFKLDRFLTTNTEFIEFIAEKGYARREFWSNEGWEFREKENWQHPLYWRKLGDDWQIRFMLEEKSLDEFKNHPVYGISFYEAEAYAKFRGKRLPTEFELEKAASFHNLDNAKNSFAVENPSRENCNFNFYYWGTTPVGVFEENPSDFAGNLWEWTSSVFKPYPDFKPFPYEDYSQTWFDGDHKVLKGGSFATSREMLRTSFRNFFRPHFRIAFAGIRCAADI